MEPAIHVKYKFCRPSRQSSEEKGRQKQSATGKRLTSLVPKTPETGYIPPDKALPRTKRSGITSSWSTASRLPVRPSPVCTSSAIQRTLYLVQSSRTPFRYPSCGRVGYNSTRVEEVVSRLAVLSLALRLHRV
jgi:hypothetical protein